MQANGALLHGSGAQTMLMIFPRLVARAAKADTVPEYGAQ
jgi:hypothetical protein